MLLLWMPNENFALKRWGEHNASPNMCHPATAGFIEISGLTLTKRSVRYTMRRESKSPAADFANACQARERVARGR